MSDRITDGMVEAFIVAAKDEPYGLDAIRAGLVAALTRRELERRTELDGMEPVRVQEVADEIARFVLELEDGPARGLASEVRARLRTGMDDRGRLEVERIKCATGAPAVIATRADRCQCVSGEPAHDPGTGYYCGNADVRED